MLQVKKTVRKAFVCFLLIAAVVVSAFAQSANVKKEYTYNSADSSYVELASNRHTRAETGVAAGNLLADLSGYEKKLENDVLEVWFNEDNASIRIRDKRSGYVWGSVGGNEESLNEEWANTASSICTVEYYDADGVERKASLSSENSAAEYSWSGEKLECGFNIEDGGLLLSFTMTLSGNGLEFAVKKGSIKESGDARIKSLYFMPFLGCVYQDTVDGYIFIPDGPGALMRFSKSSSYVSPFQKKVYGMDYGIDTSSDSYEILSERPNDFAVEMPQVTYPVYGIVHGSEQNAFFAEILSGDEYAAITAYPAGFTTDFSWAAARFDYRQKYVQPTGQDGKGIDAPQETANSMLPKISFTFLTGEDADYSGMAREYRERLIERGVLNTERKDADIPVQITLVGADVKKGFIKNKLTSLTTAKQAANIVTSLKSELKTDNFTIVYAGALKGGMNGAGYGTLKLEKKLGTLKDFTNLQNSVVEAGGRFYLNLNPVTANDSQINPSNKAATTLGKAFEKIVRDNPNVLFAERYLIRPTLVADYTSRLYKKLRFNLSIDELGSKLYSDNTRNGKLTRTQTRKIYEKLSGVVENSAYFTPNSYLWKNTGEYFGISMVNSQYVYETDTVPFLQMVLKGSIDYYAPYANIGFYNEDCILKMIEYGAYPSFMLTNADNYALHDTPLEDYFSLEYTSWKSVAADIYSKINSALKHTEGQSITEHKVLKEGIVLVKYSGGTEILINYTPNDAVTEHGEVAAKSFTVKESTE